MFNDPNVSGILALTCVLGCISFAILEKSPSQILEENTKTDPEAAKSFLQVTAGGIRRF